VISKKKKKGGTKYAKSQEREGHFRKERNAGSRFSDFQRKKARQRNRNKRRPTKRRESLECKGSPKKAP